MDAKNVAELSFGEQHFGGAKLGDARLTKRAVISADAIHKHPGGTLPDKFNSNAELFGFYDFCNNRKVTHQKTLAVHVQTTIKRMDDGVGVVLILHDTTELDFSGLDIADLGQIGHGGCRGLLCHNSLAFDCANREVLGLVSQILHRRRDVPKGETPAAKRNHPERESRLWPKALKSLPARPEGGRLRVHVADRGADCFEFMECIEGRREAYVIRSKSNRRVELEAAGGACAGGAKLHDWARKLPTAGHRTVHVSANHNQPEREAKVRVAYGSMRIVAPHPKRGEHGDEPLVVWVIHVQEQKPAPGCQPLEWILLSNVPVENVADAHARVDWYACRPVIEEYHKAQKTGCSIESPQFTTRKALEVAIAMLSVVATQLLRLRDLSRRADAATRPACEVVGGMYVEALSLWRFKERRDLTVWEFFWGLAKLGGHLNRKHDKRPGWLVLWRGWMKLQLLVEGMAIGRRKR